MNKTFVGLWVSERTRKRFKIACVVHDVHQGDVMEILLEKWLAKEHIIDDIKELIDGNKEK